MTNLLLVMADDMRVDHLPAMAQVRRLVQDRGVTFTASRCNLALCQPNRIGLLTGQLTRDHHNITIGYQGVDLDHDDTVARALAEAGYRCGLFGKYLNATDEIAGTIPRPRGWDTWRELGRERGPSDYDVRADEALGPVAGTYQTDYLADEVADFVAGPEPWFAYVAPRQPHAPYAPRPQDLHAWAHVRLSIPDDEDFASKPAWMHDRPPLTVADRAEIEQGLRGRLRELSAVDDMVGRILAAVDLAGATDRTVVIFTADNGVHQGEQRRLGEGTKGGPYDVGLRVPLVVAGPGFAPRPPVDVPVYASQDLTATLLDVAGASPRLHHQAGISLRTIVRGGPTLDRRVLLHEIGSDSYDITGDGITTGPRHPLGYLKLFHYPSRRFAPRPTFVEAYDLAADPRERVSIAHDPARRPTLDALDRLLDDLLTS